MDQPNCGARSHGTTEQSKEGTFEKKLEQDIAVCCTQCFAQPDLAGPLRHRNQHDIDDADRPETKRNQAYSAQEPIHCCEDGSHGLLVLNRVPLLPNVIPGRIKSTMIAC